MSNLPATDAKSAWYWGPMLTCLQKTQRIHSLHTIQYVCFISVADRSLQKWH